MTQDSPHLWIGQEGKHHHGHASPTGVRGATGAGAETPQPYRRPSEPPARRPGYVPLGSGDPWRFGGLWRWARPVRTLHRGNLLAGSHSLAWTGLGDAGNEVGAGVYFYRRTSGAYEQSRRITVIE